MWQELQPDDPGRIGPYRLRGVLGAGGMGRVFLGAGSDGQLVAVKVIRGDLAMDSEFRARFRREITVARKVSSRFTAPLIDADIDDPVPWLATAYVPGPSLADAVTEHGPLPARSVLELAAGLAEGLSAIHAAGVVHRDLKPSNVLLAQDGPRVIDFGISVAAETSPLTRTGLLIGSPGYMSPEQVEGREVGAASDIFSLGSVLTYAATGEAPFGSGSAPTLAYRAVYREVNLDRVPAEVRGLIQRCLAKDPGQRPAARDLMFAAGAGAVPPTERWLPEAVTRTFTGLPETGSRTVTSARLSPAAQPAPGRLGRHDARRRRRLARPLTIASLVAGLLAASAAGGIALAASAHQSSGAHTGQAMYAPSTSPASSAPATPARSAPSAAATAPAAPTTASTTPTATSTMTTSPSTSPTMGSSPAPAPSTSTSPAPAGSAAPTGATTQTGATAPSGSAAPTPAAS